MTEPEHNSASPNQISDATGEALADLFPSAKGDLSAVHRLGLLVGATICFLLGIIGWLVPVITGIPFYIVGAVLLGMALPPVGRRLNQWERGLRLERRLRLRRFLDKLSLRKRR
ncbi:MAG: hypothetical protein ACI841_002117 [Planctomycetota bacterium]|jgi:hypothetical protein